MSLVKLTQLLGRDWLVIASLGYLFELGSRQVVPLNKHPNQILLAFVSKYNLVFCDLLDEARLVLKHVAISLQKLQHVGFSRVVQLQTHAVELLENLAFVLVLFYLAFGIEKNVVVRTDVALQLQFLQYTTLVLALNFLDVFSERKDEADGVVGVELFDVLDQLVLHHQVLQHVLVVTSPSLDWELGDLDALFVELAPFAADEVGAWTLL